MIFKSTFQMIRRISIWFSGNEFDVPKIVEFWSELVHIWQSTNGLPFKTGFHIESDMSAKTVVQTV